MEQQEGCAPTSFCAPFLARNCPPNVLLSSRNVSLGLLGEGPVQPFGKPSKSSAPARSNAEPSWVADTPTDRMGCKSPATTGRAIPARRVRSHSGEPSGDPDTW